MLHRSISRRRLTGDGAAAALCALITLPALMRSGTAWAAALPARLRMLCSGPAGSIPDTVARRYAEQLTGRFAVTVLVDRRAGAAGPVAIDALRQSIADGTTMLLAQGATATVYAFLYGRLGCDPALDLKPVSLVASCACW